MDRTGPSPVTVRRLGRAEWRKLRDLRLRALETDPSAFCSTLAEERRFSARRWQERAATRAASPGRATWVAVGARGRFVGLVVGTEDEAGANVQSMWVDPVVRRSGIGRRLLAVVLAWAQKRRPEGAVRLEVNPRQEAAIALYRSGGFRETGSTRSLGHSGDDAVVEMTLPATVARAS